MFKVAGQLILFINVIIFLVLGISNLILIPINYSDVLPLYSKIVSYLMCIVCLIFAINAFILLKKNKSTLMVFPGAVILFGCGIFYLVLLCLGYNFEIYYALCVVLLVCSIISMFSIYWTRKGE